MPNVDGKKFPYTKAGMKAAAKYKKKIKPGVPSFAQKMKPTGKIKKQAPKGKSYVKATSNSVTSQQPRSETLYNMDFNKMYGDAGKRGMRRRQPMPGLTRRYIGRSNRVST